MNQEEINESYLNPDSIESLKTVVNGSSFFFVIDKKTKVKEKQKKENSEVILPKNIRISLFKTLDSFEKPGNSNLFDYFIIHYNLFIQKFTPSEVLKLDIDIIKSLNENCSEAENILNYILSFPKENYLVSLSNLIKSDLTSKPKISNLIKNYIFYNKLFLNACEFSQSEFILSSLQSNFVFELFNGIGLLIKSNEYGNTLQTIKIISTNPNLDIEKYNQKFLEISCEYSDLRLIHYFLSKLNSNELDFNVLMSKCCNSKNGNVTKDNLQFIYETKLKAENNSESNLYKLLRFCKEKNKEQVELVLNQTKFSYNRLNLVYTINLGFNSSPQFLKSPIYRLVKSKLDLVKQTN